MLGLRQAPRVDPGYGRLLVKAVVEALERMLGVPVEEYGGLDRMLQLVPTVEITVTVVKGGYRDSIRLTCIPVDGRVELAEKLGLTLRIGDKTCLIIPEGLVERGERPV